MTFEKLSVKEKLTIQSALGDYKIIKVRELETAKKFKTYTIEELGEDAFTEEDKKEMIEYLEKEISTINSILYILERSFSS